MSIDLSTVPTLTDDLGLYDIPLQRDTFPYAQLQAQGRYPDRSTPNTLPEFLATLNASDAGFTPDMLSTDGKRNLNVNVAASAVPSSGGGVGAATYNGDAPSSALVSWAGSLSQANGCWFAKTGYLTGIMVAAVISGGGGAGSIGEILLDLRDDNGDVSIDLGCFQVSVGATVLGGGAFQQYFPFLPNIDVAATWPTMSTHLNLFTGISNCSGALRYFAMGHL